MRVLCLAALFTLIQFVDALAAAPPNVVIVFADDQGTLDANCYGSKDLKTPNIDRLASRGMVFTNAQCAAPACIPSRSALMTGTSPASHISHPTNGM